MRIAYIILAHKLPEQLVRLVKKLNTDATSFIIHVDRKTDQKTYQKIVNALSPFENVYFLKRHVCNWGGFGHVQATLDGIREVFALNLQFDYAILLTGQDYPIKSNEIIEKSLEENNQNSFIEYFHLPNEIWENENGGLDRINYWHLNFLGEPRKIFPRFDLIYLKSIKRFKIFGGSSYWCLTRDCVKFIIEYLEQNDNFIKFWKYVRIPDEGFFQTLLLNSDYKGQLINDNFRYIVWSNSPHPEILGEQEYEQFITSNKLFARKFDVTVNSNILDMIDEATA